MGIGKEVKQFASLSSGEIATVASSQHHEPIRTGGL